MSRDCDVAHAGEDGVSHQFVDNVSACDGLLEDMLSAGAKDIGGLICGKGHGNMLQICARKTSTNKSSLPLIRFLYLYTLL